MSEKRTADAAGRYAYEGLDRVLHEKARLGIMTSLATRPAGLSFNELKQLCSLTDGNLNRHLDVLHRAGLVEVVKGHAGRRPHTHCRLTTAGRRRFLEYLAELEQVIRDAQAEPASAKNDWRAGFAPA
jgi:DNA-binding HxlR family transcriptional regulator